MAKELAAIPNIELETAPVPVAAPEEMPEQPLLFEDEELRQPDTQDVAAPNSTPRLTQSITSRPVRSRPLSV